MPAALASMAAHEQGKFWEYADLLFDNQKALSRDDLELYARQLGLDMDKFRAALDGKRFEDKIRRDMAEGNRAGVRGTPTIFINGRRFQPAGGYTADAFVAVIDKYILKKETR